MSKPVSRGQYRARYTEDETLAAIAGSCGLVSLIARKLGCSWDTARKYVDRWKATRIAIEAEHGQTLDLAESKLFEAIQRGEPWAVKFYLTTKGKDRGYCERHEISGEASGPLKVTFIAPRRFSRDEEWEAWAQQDYQASFRQ